MGSGGDEKKRTARSYRPTVEGLEALRLLSSATQSPLLPGLTAEHDVLADQGPGSSSHVGEAFSVSNDAWDAALVETRLADFLAGYGTANQAVKVSDPQAFASGLGQLNKYLSRAWFRASIPPQFHEDASQAVYATLLQQLGRGKFEALVGDVGRWGVKDVFSRETPEGIDFFRAVDMIKKRAQRERVFQSLDAIDLPATDEDTETRSRYEALREAIDRSLTPREASLIQDTLMGKTPAEIALHWGVAPKTVSNEKTRVFQKLREVLQAQAALD